MTIKTIRLFQLLLLPLIVVSQKYFLLYYGAVMYASLEFLNSRTEYKAQPHYKYYNSLFIAFQFLVCIDRLRPFKFETWIEWQINSVEHIIFACVICFKIVQYLNLPFFKIPALLKRMVVTFVFFNIIGVLGEIFQLSLTDNDKLVFWAGSTRFLADNIKDMQMNLMGSALFCVSLFFTTKQEHQ